MKGERVRVIKIYDNHRVYLYQRKVIYKERKNGKLVTKFVGRCISDILDSQIIGNDIKKRLTMILERSNHFFNRG